MTVGVKKKMKPKETCSLFPMHRVENGKHLPVDADTRR